MRLFDQDDQFKLAARTGKVFTPATPVDERALFAGRKGVVRQVVDAVLERGRHVIIFGERGVGKTSMTNVLSQYLESAGTEVLAPRINCDQTDTFTTVWKKVFSEITIDREVRGPWYTETVGLDTQNLAASLPDDLSPNDVRKILAMLADKARSLTIAIILDEFDRLTDDETTSNFADTIKMLSDYSIDVTLILVGAADSIEELIKKHQSIERALVQVHVPRMTLDEIEEFIRMGISHLGMGIEGEALKTLTVLSQRLPYYAHLLSLYSVREAIDHGSRTVTKHFVDLVIEKALSTAQESIQTAYEKATTAPGKDSLYAQVLLACALSSADDMGYFATADVSDALAKITGKPQNFLSFSRHLHDFSQASRGRILQKSGPKHRVRFRFANPLMQPFVILQGLAEDLISVSTLSAWSEIAEVMPLLVHDASAVAEEAESDEGFAEADAYDSDGRDGYMSDGALNYDFAPAVVDEEARKLSALVETDEPFVARAANTEPEVVARPVETRSIRRPAHIPLRATKSEAVVADETEVPKIGSVSPLKKILERRRKGR